MKVAFYKAKYGDVLDKAISWWTKSPYSHTEIYFEKTGECISSSWREGEEDPYGVRIKVIDDLFTSGHWDFIDVPDANEDEIYDKAKIDLKKGYDFAGIFLSQMFNIGVHGEDKYFCSELCAKLLGLQDPHNYSPGGLYNYMIEEMYKHHREDNKH